MRKSLVAVALAFAFPAVFAQSNVTLYGIVDVGVEQLNVGDKSGVRLQSGISAGSRWGIRGSEDLGGGYRALFTLESRFEADTGQVQNNNSMYWCKAYGDAASVPAVCPGVRIVPGTPLASLPPTSLPYQQVLGGLNLVNNTLLQSVTTVNSANALFDRQAWAGIVTPYGAILAGRQYTPGYEILNKYNIMGDQTALQFGQAFTTLSIRANNAIQYRAELKGFIGTFMYGFGGSEGNRSERAAAPGTGDDFMGANLQYATERWGVGAGWNRNNIVPCATTAPSASCGAPVKKTGMETFNVGGYFMFSNFKVAAQWMQRKNDNPILSPTDIQNLVAGGASVASLTTLQLGAIDMDTMRGLAGPTDTNAYHLGGSWRVGGGTLYGVYNWADDKARSAWATQDAKIQHFGIGYIYDFSRRTQLYAAAAWLKNSDQARASLSSAGYTTGWTTAPGEDATAYQLGVRHNF